jgi:hypothetical protein
MGCEKLASGARLLRRERGDELLDELVDFDHVAFIGGVLDKAIVCVRCKL